MRLTEYQKKLLMRSPLEEGDCLSPRTGKPLKHALDNLRKLTERGLMKWDADGEWWEITDAGRRAIGQKEADDAAN